MSSIPNLRTSLVYVLICLLILSGLLTITTGQSHVSNKSQRHSLTPNVKESAEKTGPQTATVAATRSRVNETSGKLPLIFQENRGRTDHRVKYVSRGKGYALFLTPTEAVLALRIGEGGSRNDRPSRDLSNPQSATGNPKAARPKPTILRMKLTGANPTPAVKGEREIGMSMKPSEGNDPEKQQASAARYEGVRYEQVYPGVDMIYYGEQQQLEYDFEVASGADASRIALEFAGVKRVKVERGTGNLVLETAGGVEFRQHKPVAYQEVEGVRREVESHYVVKGKKGVSIEVGEYNRARPLVINPVLSYPAYLSGDGKNSGTTSASDSRTPDQPRQDQPVRKTADFGPYSIFGHVTDGGFQTDVVWYITLAIDGSDSDYAFPDDGSYSFGSLEAGRDYTITPYSAYYNFLPASRTFHNLQSNEIADFEVSHFYYIGGYVANESGHGFEGLPVLLDGPDYFDMVYTNRDGSYFFFGAGSGDNVVYPMDDNYAFDPEEYHIYDVPVEGVEADFTATPTNTYSISGRLTRSDGSGLYQPVKIYGGVSDTTYTDSNGYYSFDDLPAGGNYTVYPVYSNYLTFDYEEQHFDNLRSDQTADFATLPVSISGSVGVGGATVTLTHSGYDGYVAAPHTVVSASDGSYVFTDVPVPLHYLTVKPTLTNYRFFSPQPTIFVLQGDVTDFNFSAIPKTYGIVGVVRLGTIRLPGVTVTLTSPAPAGFPPQITTTTSGGAYSFDHLPPGRRYTVTPMINGYQLTPASKSLAPLNANQSAVDFAVKNYGITGRIARTGTTTGISAVTVTLTSPTPANFPARTVRTNSAGVYTFTTLPAGRNYTIKVLKNGFTFTPATRSFTNLSHNIPVGASTNFTGVGP